MGNYTAIANITADLATSIGYDEIQLMELQVYAIRLHKQGKSKLI
jgi:hypothetical protein